VRTDELGKRYRRTWALQPCTLRIPAGRVVALVGPNGAGKTTLLHLIVGLATPTTGAAVVLDGVPAGTPLALDRVAFVAQDAPLYGRLSAAETLDLARLLNRAFDRRRAERRLAELGIPLGRRVGRLSGGQQAQLALTLALARHPELLILDEPHARLDPLARHEFMASLVAEADRDGVSVLLSSHIVAELEPVADDLILLTGGEVRLAGEIAVLLRTHAMLRGPATGVREVAGLPGTPVVLRGPAVAARADGPREEHLVARLPADARTPDGWTRTGVSLEELVLAYLREPPIHIGRGWTG
jgi:ABC-2 type transport system ATP-binding protein